MDTIEVFLAKAQSGRWYFTARSFISHTIKDKDGKSYECLAPIGNNDTRNLDPSAITTFILPVELNELSRDKMVKKFGDVADLDAKTGKLSLR